MKRFIFSKTKTRNNQEAARLNDALRQEMLRTLEREANTLLKGLQSQFEKDLSRSLSESLRFIDSNANTNSAGGGQGLGTSNAFASLTRVIGSVLRLRRSSVRSNSQETTRSQEAFSQFRLSRAQSVAEASEALGAGERSL